jgi:hypothetical protein
VLTLLSLCIHPSSNSLCACCAAPQVNVFVLGGVYLQLVELLRLTNSPALSKPVDPSLYLHRFTEALPLGDKVGGGHRGLAGSRTRQRLLAVRDPLQHTRNAQ